MTAYKILDRTKCIEESKRERESKSKRESAHAVKLYIIQFREHAQRS